MATKETADLVIVGGGTIGGWAAWFARRNGAKKVVVLERGLVGEGASSRSAGVVRQQGGTPSTVRLGIESVAFYRQQQDLFGIDSGFRELGYLILAVTKDDVAGGQRRIEMQRAAGLDVDWLDANRARERNPTLAPTGYRGGTYVATDGCIDPSRNVLAYTAAMRQAKVDLRERTAFLGLRTRAAGKGRHRVTGVRTSAGTIATERVILTGGPSLRREVGPLVGATIPVGAARHQCAVSEPHEDLEVERLPMVFDIGAGIYWRLHEGGLLWGMSNPDETPGEAREIDWLYLRKMQRRLAKLVPVTGGLGIRKAWAATIDYTPDHMPILGPVHRTDGAVIEGTTIANACGHGMMWGPAVSRIAADLAIAGTTRVIDDVERYGMDRFDATGRSSLAADPISLPFPLEPDD
ncbi:MAG: FAD-binding oxidoreductase [Actinomycetota bacterium]